MPLANYQHKDLQTQITELRREKMAKGMIQTEYNAFKYEAKDNRRIQRIALTRVFEKSGFYIFNLGLVTFLE
jgi:hypothetical protein